MEGGPGMEREPMNLRYLGGLVLLGLMAMGGGCASRDAGCMSCGPFCVLCQDLRAGWADATDLRPLTKDLKELGPHLCDTRNFQKDVKTLCSPSLDTGLLCKDLSAFWADATDLTGLQEDAEYLREVLHHGECRQR
jgi:hypothetical protein